MNAPLTQEPVIKPGFGPLFRNHAFVVMWLGQVLSQTADKLVFILIVVIVGKLSLSPTVMSGALAANTTPNMLFGALAGVLVDRLDKRRVMMGSNAGRVVMVVAMGIWGTHTLAPTIVLAFLISCCAQPFIPAEAAAMPLVAGKDMLLQANSLFATTMIASIVIAFTVGEPLVAWLGTENACFFTAGMFALSVVLLYFVRYRYPDQQANHDESFWKQLITGFKFILASPPIRRTLILQTCLFGMLAAMSVLAIVFAKLELHTNFSWFLAMAGAGLGLGAWIVGRFGTTWSKDTTVTTGFVVCGLALVTLGLTGATSLYIAFGISAVMGFAASLVAVPLQTRLQELVSEEMRGKLFGAQNTLLNIATTLPLACAGLLAERFGIKEVIGAVGSAMLVAGAAAWWSARSLARQPAEVA
jgi:MFS family permease